MGNGKPCTGIMLAAVGLSAMLVGCASQIAQTKVASPAESQAPAPPSYNGLKHRLAVATFEDKSGYSNNLFGSVADLGGQGAAILVSHLVKTGEFIIVERQNLKNLKDENALQQRPDEFTGVSALIFGAVTEFGTKTEHVDQGIAKSKVQTAHAKTTIRLVDPLTGIAFFSEFGEANVSKESNQVLGFGQKAEYDGTLADKALNAAITKLVGNILSSLRALPWRAPILQIQSDTLFIGAGQRTGLTAGKVLSVYRPGNRVQNPVTKAFVELPGTVVGKVRVVSLFGTSDLDEGAICVAVEGKGFAKTDRIQNPEGAQ